MHIRNSCYQTDAPTLAAQFGQTEREYMYCDMHSLCIMQVELAGWTSPDIVKSLLLKDMPDLMRKDTEKLMDENAMGKKQAQRFTRREAAIRAAATQSTATADAGAGAGMQAAQSPAQAKSEEDSVSLFKILPFQ